MLEELRSQVRLTENLAGGGGGVQGFAVEGLGFRV